ncbi:DNA (cytosine-5-)-methyltransferase [Isoptericola sp. AK164]|uniref:DNA (cytosine-5-)-methyltransferase n=1 Tax=Isoptericola sp. AK164 TaxID=3024246 RepID=UPI00241852F6|nr:DNA (cytosine-5-)-methyltransferase [Isoptericola sp. AK164]
MSEHAFRYVDLFAGIGGFHAVLDAMGGECVYAVEIDSAARAVYRANWGISALGNNDKGDITLDTQSQPVNVPKHDVLVAGFPCQPFSKSGAQRGMEEARGTLFFHIMRIIEDRRPAVVLLENVRNLAGPRHIHEWEVIIKALRQAGYRVSESSSILSPAKISPEDGGHPQTRERVFIAATRIKPLEPSEKYLAREEPRTRSLPSPFEDVAPITLEAYRMTKEWNLWEDLPLNRDRSDDGTVSPTEWMWIDHWDEWVQKTRELLAYEARQTDAPTTALPGFPIWANVWTTDDAARATALSDAQEMPWKTGHLTKNYRLYDRLRKFDSEWTATWLGKTRQFPESRQKFEWQAQMATSVRDCVVSFRPSGLRVKRPTHLPTLVAISQTPVIGPLKRRLSVEEGALLQGLPADFDWAGQREAATWKQLGNGVNTGVVAQALRAQVERDADLLELDVRGQRVFEAVTKTMADSGGDLRTRIAETLSSQRISGRSE